MRPAALKTAIQALALLLSLPAARAEYVKFFEQDFEGPEWPQKLVHGHNSSPITTQLFPMSETATPQLLAEGAGAHIGSQVLRFEPLQDDPHLSVVNQAVLSRQKLGTSGAALFQVDFFLEESDARPRIALLAQGAEGEDPAEKSQYRFYRFGVDEKDRVFLSFTNGKAGNVFYEKQAFSELGLKRPGWHRFQMIFKGQETIHCAVDGKQTSFSPITDGTLTRLSGGIMVTRAEADATVYADNLSIYYTANAESDLITSPWGDAPQPLTMTALKWNTDKLLWLTSTSEAWKESQASGKAMFVLFHSDDATAHAGLVALLGSPEAVAVLERCVLLRVDMSQVSGQKVAQGFGVSTAPVLMVCDRAGKPKSRVVLDPAAMPAWAEVYAQLRGGSAPAGGAPAN